MAQKHETEPKSIININQLTKEEMTKSNKGSVLVGATVVIESLEISDAQVVAAVKAAQADNRDLIEYITTSVEIGVKSIVSTGAMIGIDDLAGGIKNATSSMVGAADKLKDDLQVKIDAITGENGVLDTNISKVIAEFTTKIEGLTASEASPIQAGIKTQMADMAKKLMDDFARETKRQKSEIKEIFADQLEVINNGVQGVLQEVQKNAIIAKVIENTPQKGLPYEDQVIESIQRIAGLAGDECEATGKQVGLLPRRFAGDGVIGLKPNGDKVTARVVVEAKNRRLTKKDWLEEIEVGKANRGATGFIGFSKNIEDMPNKNRIMIFDRQTILVSYDPETEDPQIALIVYQLVKMNTLAAAGHLDDTRISEINEGLDRAFTSLRSFDGLSRNARSVEKLGKQLTKDIGLLKAEIVDSLEAIQSSMSLDLDAVELEGRQVLEIEALAEENFIEVEELGINLDRPDKVA
jgi:hypothetical protein